MTKHMTEVWQKKHDSKIACADEFVTIIEWNQLAIHARGEGPAYDTYVFGKFEFLENFTKVED